MSRLERAHAWPRLSSALPFSGEIGVKQCIEAEHGDIAAEARCLQNACRDHLRLGDRRVALGEHAVASCKRSTLAIYDRQLGSDFSARALARRVGIGVVERIHRIPRRDLEADCGAGCHVAHGKLHPVALGVPKEENLDRPAPPLGQFSTARADLMDRWGRRAVAVADDTRALGGSVNHRPRSSCPLHESSFQ
jgi:hypothetical protein